MKVKPFFYIKKNKTGTEIAQLGICRFGSRPNWVNIFQRLKPSTGFKKYKYKIPHFRGLSKSLLREFNDMSISNMDLGLPGIYS